MHVIAQILALPGRYVNLTSMNVYRTHVIIVPLARIPSAHIPVIAQVLVSMETCVTLTTMNARSVHVRIMPHA